MPCTVQILLQRFLWWITVLLLLSLPPLLKKWLSHKHYHYFYIYQVLILSYRKPYTVCMCHSQCSWSATTITYVCECDDLPQQYIHKTEKEKQNKSMCYYDLLLNKQSFSFSFQYFDSTSFPLPFPPLSFHCPAPTLLLEMYVLYISWRSSCEH